jgi:hypothetical protein
VSGSVPPAGAGIGARVVVAAGGVLDRLGARGLRAAAEAAVLLYEHPRWAIWLPGAGGEWVAVRPAGSRPPGQEMPMVWVRAGTAGGLAAQMVRADAALSGGAGSG